MPRPPRHESRERHVPPPPRLEGDLGRLAGLLLIGAFVVGLVYLATTSGAVAAQVAIGFLIATGFLVHVYAVRAYRGGALMGWQASLARLALRLGGFGATRPLAAARRSSVARIAILVSVALWVVLIAALSLVLIQATR